MKDIDKQFAENALQLLGADSIKTEELHEMALASGIGRARHLLHKSHNDQPQTMLIYLQNGSKVGLHRHPVGKTEIYIVLEGILEVEYLVEGEHSNIRTLAPWGNKEGFKSISIHRDGVWHEPKAATNYTLYLEIYSGPFDKEIDVEYK